MKNQHMENNSFKLRSKIMFFEVVLNDNMQMRTFERVFTYTFDANLYANDFDLSKGNRLRENNLTRDITSLTVN